MNLMKIPYRHQILSNQTSSNFQMPENLPKNIQLNRWCQDMDGTNGKKPMSGLKKEQNAFVTAYINSNHFLSNLTDDIQYYYGTLLTDMDITNTHAITTQVLNTTKVNEAKAYDEVASILTKSSFNWNPRKNKHFAVL